MPEWGGVVHYNKPPFFCRLTLSDDSVVEIEGSGELTDAMTSAYTATCVSVETGKLCTSIGDYAFYHCSGLTSVIISNSVTSIDTSAFLGCSGLTSIDIPNSVTSIGNGAFELCKCLTSLIIPNSVTSIGDGAFELCSSLTSITIPSSVTSIDGRAFSSCSSLTEVYYDAQVEFFSLGYGDSLETVIIGDSTPGIYHGALNTIHSLRTVSIGSGVTSIGSGVFANCDGLESVTITAIAPPSLIGSGHFYNSNDCPIYVPTASVDAYKTASGWSTYALRIQAIPTT